MTVLDQLEKQLQEARRLWQYETRIEGKLLTEEAKIEIAQKVLIAPKSWAEGLAAEFASRHHPSDFEE